MLGVKSEPIDLSSHDAAERGGGDGGGGGATSPPPLERPSRWGAAAPAAAASSAAPPQPTTPPTPPTPYEPTGPLDSPSRRGAYPPVSPSRHSPSRHSPSRHGASSSAMLPAMSSAALAQPPPPMRPQPPSGFAVAAPPRTPSNLYTNDQTGERFYVTLLQMMERGAWVPITQVSILDPGFPIPPASRVEFKPAAHDMGVGRELTKTILHRFYSTDAFLHADDTIAPEQQAKFAREYVKFFRYMATGDRRERFARIQIGAITFYLKGPAVEMAGSFGSNEPLLCFFTAPAPAPEWTPTHFVHHPESPEWAQRTQSHSLSHGYHPHGYDAGLSPFAQASQQQHHSFPQHYLPPQQQVGAPSYVPSVPPAIYHPGAPSTVKSERLVSPAASSASPVYAAATSHVAPPPHAIGTTSSVVSIATPTPVAAAATLAPNNNSTVLMSHHFLRDLTHQHDWPFGALAELVHNAKDAGAKYCKISVRRIGPHKLPHLIVDDDGNGMTHQELRHALMFGRVADRARGKETIGKFGFGLKHGTMRLGDDVLVLTKSQSTFSIGLLSQTYNKTQSSVKAPIITRLKDGNKEDLTVHTKADADEAEEVIRQYSVFDHFTIGAQMTQMAPRGTRIIVWKLRHAEQDPDETAAKSKADDSSSSSSEDEEDDPTKKERRLAHKKKLQQLAAAKAATQKKRLTGDEQYELKFATAPHDLQLVIDPVSNMQERSNQMSTDVPLDYSLTAYLSMLFLDNKMKLWVQGQAVPHLDWNKELTKIRTTPCTVKHFEKCKLILGYSEVEKSRGNCGMMLYWHNCLIETYRRVGIQTGNSDAGLGVIGVFEMGDKVEPKNNKQGFPQSNKYFKKILKWFAEQLDLYWHEVLEREVVQLASAQHYEQLAASGGIESHSQAAQCDKCQQWRAVTTRELDIIDGKIKEDGSKGDGKERKWYCYMNKDPKFSSCVIPQDPDLQDDERDLVLAVSRGGKAAGSDDDDAPITPVTKNVIRVPNPAAAKVAAASAAKAAADKAAAADKPAAAKVKAALAAALVTEQRQQAIREGMAKQREIEAALKSEDDDTPMPPRGPAALPLPPSNGTKKKQPTPPVPSRTTPSPPVTGGTKRKADDVTQPTPKKAKPSPPAPAAAAVSAATDSDAEQGDSDDETETSGDDSSDEDGQLHTAAAARAAPFRLPSALTRIAHLVARR